MAIAMALTDEKLKEHDELYGKLVAAVSHANTMLLQHGIRSREFEEADEAAGGIAEDIHRLIGSQHWVEWPKGSSQPGGGGPPRRDWIAARRTCGVALIAPHSGS